MARTSPPEKLRRITTFLYGLTNEEMQRYLNDFGMSVQEMARHPEIGQVVFQDLSQSSGKDVIITVQLFLDRLDELGMAMAVEWPALVLGQRVRMHHAQGHLLTFAAAQRIIENQRHLSDPEQAHHDAEQHQSLLVNRPATVGEEPVVAAKLLGRQRPGSPKEITDPVRA